MDRPFHMRLIKSDTSSGPIDTDLPQRRSSQSNGHYWGPKRRYGSSRSERTDTSHDPQTIQPGFSLAANHSPRSSSPPPTRPCQQRNSRNSHGRSRRTSQTGSGSAHIPSIPRGYFYRPSGPRFSAKNESYLPKRKQSDGRAQYVYVSTGRLERGSRKGEFASVTDHFPGGDGLPPVTHAQVGTMWQGDGTMRGREYWSEETKNYRPGDRDIVTERTSHIHAKSAEEAQPIFNRLFGDDPYLRGRRA